MLYLFNLRNDLSLSNAFSKSVYSTSMQPLFSKFSVYSSKTFKSSWTVEKLLICNVYRSPSSSADNNAHTMNLFNC